MKRTNTQKSIIPRNWLFGRISWMKANLDNLKSSPHFTEIEVKNLNEASLIMEGLIKNKKFNSEKIKREINEKSISKIK